MMQRALVSVDDLVQTLTRIANLAAYARHQLRQRGLHDASAATRVTLAEIEDAAQRRARPRREGRGCVNGFSPLPIDIEKRRQAMWILRGEGWNFYSLARAFGTSLTEARQAVDPKHHTPQRTFLCDEEGRS